MESRTSIHLQVLIVHEQYFAIFGVNNDVCILYEQTSNV